MISIQCHTAEQLTLHFHGSPELYGLTAGETDGTAVTIYNVRFAVSGGYLQIFGPLIMVIAMSEIRSLAFISAKGERIEGSSIAVE